MTPANTHLYRNATTGLRVLGLILNAMAGVAVIIFAAVFMGVLP